MTTITEPVEDEATDDTTVEPTAEQVRAAAELDQRRRTAELLKRSRETRDAVAGSLEVREADDGSTLTLCGLACRTGVEYDVGIFREIVEPGAFRRTLGENPDVQLLVNHGMGGQLPLARTRSGTLRLTETDDGLEVEADLDPANVRAVELAQAMRRGDVDGMSFAFQVTDDAWSEDLDLRTIRSLSLHRGDVSVVNQGANPAAYATMRALAVDALAQVTSAELIAAWVEWRDHTLIPVEDRAGKTLSAATMEVLSQVLSLVADADDSLDDAQPLLADLMGVANPDDPEPDEPEPEPVEAEAAGAAPARAAVPDLTTRARQELDLLIARGTR